MTVVKIDITVIRRAYRNKQSKSQIADLDTKEPYILGYVHERMAAFRHRTLLIGRPMLGVFC
jgi:hypothetical protein